MIFLRFFFLKTRAMNEVIYVDDETFEVVRELKGSRFSLKKQNGIKQKASKPKDGLFLQFKNVQ